MAKLKSRILIALAVTAVFVILVLAIIINNVGAISDPYMNERYIDKQTFQGEWPFTSAAGVIRCDNAGSDKAISFNSSEGKTYSLNNTAQLYSDKNNLGWQSLDIQNIQQLDANINDVIQLGSALCIKW